MTQMRNKGQSEIISWVLLIGLAVSLAVIVTVWTREQAEESIEGVVSKSESDYRCNEVSFNAVVDCNTGNVDVVNKGNFNIHRFIVHEYMKNGNTETLTKETAKPLEVGKNTPQDLYTISQTGNIKSIDLIPVIKIDKEYVGCVERKLVFEC